jgi:hypothetical protein
MLKAWLIGTGVVIAGLLAASCAATPQSAATAYAANVAADAATRTAVAATREANKIYVATTQAVDQAIANAKAGLPSVIPGYEGRTVVVYMDTFIFIQKPDGQQYIVNIPPKKNTYANGDPKPKY